MERLIVLFVGLGLIGLWYWLTPRGFHAGHFLFDLLAALISGDPTDSLLLLGLVLTLFGVFIYLSG